VLRTRFCFYCLQLNSGYMAKGIATGLASDDWHLVPYSRLCYIYSYHERWIMPVLRRRKNVFIDQRRINRVKALLHTETETETIDRALALAEEMAVFEAEVDRGLATLVGRGGFVDRFGARDVSR